MSALNLIYKDRLTFGIELPLDRDWSEAGQRRARIDGRPFGVPDISNPAKGVELAECLGSLGRDSLYRATVFCRAERAFALCCGRNDLDAGASGGPSWRGARVLLADTFHQDGPWVLPNGGIGAGCAEA